MEVSGIFSAIIVGLIVGALGRLVVPGRQAMPIWMTMIIGVVAAIVGALIAASFTSSFIITLVIQVALAALAVFLIAGSRGRSARV